MEKKKFYITTPIYYPSDKLHIGHTYCTVATDAMARYKRLTGYDVMFLTGTDEHGQKIEDKAKAAGVTPQQFVDNIVCGEKGILDLWKLMNISNDRFIRTTDNYHVEAIQKIFKKMHDNGDIYKGTYKGKYCKPCESFWTESQLVDGKCPDCGREVEDAEEEAYFFKLSKYADRVQHLLEDTDFLQPASRVNEMVNNFIKPGLEDLCVSRTSFTWGIPVDFDPGHIVYVWVDALFNYCTALGFMNEKYDDYDKYWPADVHFVGKEIVRFHSIIWPAMLMSMGMPLPKHVYGHGWLVMDGGKMSKSKGNAVDPMDALRQHGADAIRWYFYSNSAPWLPNRFHDDAVKEGRSKFMGTLWNTYAFYVLYANIDNFNPMEHTLDYEKLSVMDKWILSKLNSTIQTCDSSLENYKIPETAKALQEFVDDLSNWYVRRSRERYWAKGMEQDKVNAYMTLYTCLTEIAKAAAPMIPFMTEEIYQNIVVKVDPSAPESIHLCDYPKANEAHVDKELEADMDLVLKVVVLGRACRNSGNMKNRQPLANMFVKAPFTLNEFFKDIIADELNIKTVTFTDDVRSFTTYTFKPQLRTVGPKYGKLLGKIRTALSSVDGNATMDELKANGSVTFDFDGEKVVLTEEDLLIDMTQKEGYVTGCYSSIRLQLNTRAA